MYFLLVCEFVSTSIINNLQDPSPKWPITWVPSRPVTHITSAVVGVVFSQLCMWSSTSQKFVNGHVSTIDQRSFAVAGPWPDHGTMAISTKQCSGCSMETRDDTAHFQATRPVCSTSDVLTNRTNIHHRPALL